MAANDILPTGLISRADVLHLHHELELLDEALYQGSVRKGGKATSTTILKSSQLLNDVAEAYKYNLLHKEDRSKLLDQLKQTHKDAPALHVSFATNPTPVFLQKLVKWLRAEIHPQVLVQVGLQPSIAAGCVVRSPNKVLDFSVRQALVGKQKLLLEQIQGKSNG